MKIDVWETKARNFLRSSKDYKEEHFPSRVVSFDSRRRHLAKTTDTRKKKARHSQKEEPLHKKEPPRQVQLQPDSVAASSELDLPRLKPGQIMGVRKHDGTLVSKYGSRVGLPPQLRQSILKYCDETGMMTLVQLLLQHSLGNDESKTFHLGAQNDVWEANRPPKKTWNSNMHWIEPFDEYTQDRFLKALGRGGFDTILNAIGTHFDCDGLYIHSISIVGVSRAEQDSYLHWDFMNTGGKGFNVIIPLIDVPNSPPELHIQDETDHETQYAIKYNYDTAFVTGDAVMHRTSPINYDIGKGEMRVSATVYLSDINEANVDRFVGDTTPADEDYDREDLLEKSGTHWSPQGNRLPQ